MTSSDRGNRAQAGYSLRSSSRWSFRRTSGFGDSGLWAILRRSGAWAAGLAFLVLAGAVAAVFTIAALAIGLIMTLGVALVWVVARLHGARSTRRPSHDRELDATRGPRGWTVDVI